MDMLKGVMAHTDVANVDKMLPVISDIVNEENKHVGQLQELLKIISPNATSIEQGAAEGAAQIANSEHEWVNGKLKVEMHPEQRTSDNIASNEVDTTCTLYNVDDEF
jgi:rubrerythrin